MPFLHVRGTIRRHDPPQPYEEPESTACRTVTCWWPSLNHGIAVDPTLLQMIVAVFYPRRSSTTFSCIGKLTRLFHYFLSQPLPTLHRMYMLKSAIIPPPAQLCLQLIRLHSLVPSDIYFANNTHSLFEAKLCAPQGSLILLL